MKITKTGFRDLLVIEPSIFADNRGVFFESFNEAKFRIETGLNISFVQDNESTSAKNVIRGMHFQIPPKGQAKLVRVVRGAVLDVVIDLRKTEPTFGKHFKIELSAENKQQLFVPEGFAHGFLVLQEDSVFAYKCSNYYSKELESSLRWDDPAFAIDWGVANPILSIVTGKERDGANFKLHSSDMNARVYIIAAAVGIASSAIVLGLFAFVNRSKPGKAENDAYRQIINGEYRIFAMPLPERIDFAGEEVPLDRPDVRESLDREILVNTYWHSNTLLAIKRAYRWFPIIEPILKANEIPDDFKYLAVIESALTNASSPAGARGFWQFLEDTGKSYGLQIDEQVDERYDVAKSTYAACHYLKDAYDIHGSWSMAAASYNMGMGGLQKRAGQQYQNAYWDLLLNEETARYVYRILAIKEIFNHADQYGFVIRPAELYEPLKYTTIQVSSSIPDLAAFAKEQGISYKLLKWYNPWLRESYLKVAQGANYEIKIPA